jgi:hypothetical protein
MTQQGGKTDPFGERGFNLECRTRKEREGEAQNMPMQCGAGISKRNAYFLMLDKPYG